MGHVHNHSATTAMPHDHAMHMHMHDMKHDGMATDDSTMSSTMDPSMHHDSHSLTHTMIMYFHGGYSETILFEGWTIDSLGGLIGSMFGIFIMAALYEGLKYYREYLFWKTYSDMQYRSVSMPAEKSPNERRINMVGEVMHKRPRPTMMSLPHVFQTGMHIVQIVLSYFLMLIFMTYNTWLCIAVVAGAAVGYFLFGWKKTVIMDVTEHCH
ncbi:High affinity copper uptake protein 1 [Blattella germanica]|nr:High affinity copper uptake protein 1 [Blattella germanica]